MREDKHTIINHIVAHAADIMEAKVEHLEDLVEVFREKGDTERVQSVGRDIEPMKAAVALMREYGGCWA